MSSAAGSRAVARTLKYTVYQFPSTVYLLRAPRRAPAPRARDAVTVYRDAREVTVLSVYGLN